jgi:hypothetical protein
MSQLAEKPVLDDVSVLPQGEEMGLEGTVDLPELVDEHVLAESENETAPDAEGSSEVIPESPSIMADVRRFRRGEVPLWKAFWVYFVLGSITATILSVAVDLGFSYLTNGQGGFFLWLVSFSAKLVFGIYPVFAGYYTSRITERERWWIKVPVGLVLIPVVIAAGFGLLILLVSAGFSIGNMNFDPNSLATSIPAGC